MSRKVDSAWARFYPSSHSPCCNNLIQSIVWCEDCEGAWSSLCPFPSPSPSSPYQMPGTLLADGQSRINLQEKVVWLHGPHWKKGGLDLSGRIMPIEVNIIIQWYYAGVHEDVTNWGCYIATSACLTLHCKWIWQAILYFDGSSFLATSAKKYSRELPY